MSEHVYWIEIPGNSEDAKAVNRLLQAAKIIYEKLDEEKRERIVEEVKNERDTRN
jgi:hypothetical protein